VATSPALSAVVAVLLAACAHDAAQPQPQPASHPEHGGHAHRFDDAERWAKVFDDPARDAWQHPDEVIAALALTPAMTVADVGAGTGYFTVRLARALPDGAAIAVDIEPDMVRYVEARARREGLANVRAVQSTPDDPRLEPVSVDRVLIVDTWHHVDDRVAFAKKLAAALKPGGQIAIVDFTLDASHGPARRHRLAPDQVIAELAAAGFVATVAPVQLPEQYVVIANLR
jgi:predicted methyltransferase